jgi:presenilin-like A22 family membrane protease
LREVLFILLLFVLAQAIGIFVGVTVIDGSRIYPDFAALNVSPAGSANAESSLAFMLYVVAGAALMLLILKFYKGDLLFKLLEASIIFTASNVVFFVVLFALGLPLAGELSLLMSLGLVLAKLKWRKVKNAAALIASAGVGAIFGFSLDPLPALAFMAGLSLYDLLAVFWTKHMVTMAKELGRRDLAFSISAEGTEKVRAPMSSAQAKGGKGAGTGGVAVQKFVDRKTSLELGTGDMAIPLMLAVSSYKTGTIWAPIIIALSCTAALYVVLWYVMKHRTFLPALPPLCAAGALAYGLTQALRI